MTSPVHTVSGNARPAEALLATETDRGGLLVYGAVLPFAKARAPGRASGPGPGVLRLTPEECAVAIAMATRAPSLHNTQPWQFRLAGNAVELLVDQDRWLRRVDPDGRELVISCGAALFGLRLGLRSLGLLPVTELLPDLSQPRLAGRVRPAGHAAMNRVEAELVAAVPHRHTHRGAFAPGEVAARLLTALAGDAAAEGAELSFVDQIEVTDQLVGVTEAAAAGQRANVGVTAETRSWVRPPGSRARDGVPAWAILGTTAAPLDQPRLPQRDFGEHGTDQPGSVPPSATAVLSTAGDTPADWLRAGQALHRLLLRAATRWVFASLQSQPLESPRYRQDVRDLLGLAGHPHLLLQFGRSNTAPATPRRQKVELRAH
jgi:hypothetical protein